MSVPPLPSTPELAWWMAPVGCGFWLLLLGALASVPVVLQARGFDLDDRCRPGERGRCISVEEGVVDSSDASTESVVLRFESGLEYLSLRGDGTPDSGSRVRAERWKGRVIGFRDLRHERDYHTTNRPQARLASVGRVLIAAALVMLAAVARLLIVQARRAGTRRRDGTRSRDGRADGRSRAGRAR